MLKDQRREVVSQAKEGETGLCAADIPPKDEVLLHASNAMLRPVVGLLDQRRGISLKVEDELMQTHFIVTHDVDGALKEPCEANKYTFS
jgi:hypothetical protein